MKTASSTTQTFLTFCPVPFACAPWMSFLAVPGMDLGDPGAGSVSPPSSRGPQPGSCARCCSEAQPRERWELGETG